MSGVESPPASAAAEAAAASLKTCAEVHSLLREELTEKGTTGRGGKVREPKGPPTRER